MRFAFTDEQELLHDSVRDFLDREWTADRLRRTWDHPGERVALWGRLAELGVIGMTVPSRLGGMGLDELDLVRVLEACGRAGLPGPIVETIAVGVPLLVEAGDETWLPRIAAGRARVSVGLEHMPFVLDADVVDLLLIARGGAFYAIAAKDATLSHEPSIDGARRLYRVEAELSAATRLGGASLEAAFDRGALAASAQLLGLCQRMIEMTVEYVKLREQFGRPVGSFQAVKHHLADAQVALEFARPAVYRAAYATARAESDRAVLVSLAKSLASEAGELAAQKALQCHGAIGYSFEHSLHLFMKRTWALAASWGDAAWHRERVGQLVLDGGR